MESVFLLSHCGHPEQSRRIGTFALMLFAALALAACSREKAASSSALVDDFGDTLHLGARPNRIVSLNPTTTEILFAVGAGSRVVGRTSYDIFPAEVKQVADLGAGLRPNVEGVLATHPDLVILYASEGNRDAARQLRSSGVATASFRIDRIRDFTRVTMILGRLLGDSIAASRTVDSVSATLARVRSAAASLPHPKVFWPFWESPIMSVGGGSFVNELIETAGGTNVFGDLPQPSPTVSFEELLRRNPDVIVTGEKTRAKLLADARWRTLRAVRDTHFVIIDTTIVNGPGPRVGANALELARLLHPGTRF
jgi:iron complex transport system substrate-binding protein